MRLFGCLLIVPLIAGCAAKTGPVLAAPESSSSTVSMSLTAPPAPSPENSGSTTCSVSISQSVILGGTDGVLRGNPEPWRVAVRQGLAVRITARFGERQLTFPTANSTVLVPVCQMREGWAFTTVFRAAHPGTAKVDSRTSTCPPCLQLGFDAQVVVTTS